MNIFIDPAYTVYYQNELFNAENKQLNRDDTLAPFIRMHSQASKKDLIVQTADFLYANEDVNIAGDYYSFGLFHNLDSLLKKKNVCLKAFVVFEPPVVAPSLYKYLPILTEHFEAVYVHNTVGDGYSLQGVNEHKLKKLYWPQPYNNVIENYWNRENRLNRIVVINGNHKPASYKGELYSKRIEVMAQLNKENWVDLYGRDWDKWWSRVSLWLPYWKNRSELMSIYKGACSSKLEILSQYNFSLCFENMAMEGYITEKIFDGFYAGTVPIYLGAKDIQQWIPENTYIDFRNFKTISDLIQYLNGLSSKNLQDYKENARIFLQSDEGLKYYNGVENSIGINDVIHGTIEL